MNQPRLFFSFLLVVLMAFSGGCNSSKKKKGDERIALARFMVEASGNEAGGTVVLPRSGTTIRVSPKSHFTEYDIVKCEVVDNELGKSLLFQFNEQASRDLYRLSATSQGLRIVTAVNGTALGAQRINSPIGNGYIVTYVELDAEELPDLAAAITRTSLDAQAELKKKEKMIGANVDSKAGRGIALRLIAGALVLSGCSDTGESSANGAKTVRAPAAAPPRPTPVELIWPTPNPAYFEGRGVETFIQPTVSGLVTSGLFGSVRSGGAQFHEGLDLFPLERDRKGEALDPVGAAMAGVVRHVSSRPGASSYGRYVVLEHPGQSPAVYTLYAHLADIAPGVAPGVEVRAGAPLGTMGRSAGGYTIPKDRAHLHFEIGVRMTDSFAAWYKRRGYGSPNTHGLYNGMNLMGLDPLEFFARRQSGGLYSLDEVFRALPAAVTLRIAHAGTPDFVRRYPTLVVGGEADSAPVGGWEIDFSATGVPVRWRRLAAGECAGWKNGEVRVLTADKTLLAANRGRDLLDTKRGVDVPGDDLRTVLQQLFDWRG